LSATNPESNSLPVTHSKLQGQVVLITGAASGIGAATALEVRARGGVPVLLDCDAEPLARVAKQCGAGTLALVADVTRLAAMQEAVAQVLAQLGHIDVVFANAGVAAFGPLAHVDPDAWKRCVEVNLFGVKHGSRCAAVHHAPTWLRADQRLGIFLCPSPCDVGLCRQQICGGGDGQFMAY
jgi:NAD(P)-dependent dehydrogenase (short-subunit alcohol dehydrogenase family)